jgi:hypothetical protein
MFEPSVLGPMTGLLAELAGGGGRLVRHSGPYRYVWPSELDLMGKIAGFRLRDRWRAGTGRRSPPTAAAGSPCSRSGRNTSGPAGTKRPAVSWAWPTRPGWVASGLRSNTATTISPNEARHSPARTSERDPEVEDEHAGA